MTPKEKAEELVRKFLSHSYNGAVEENDELMGFYHAKQCALIAVNEILEVTKEAVLPMSGATGYDYDSYWLEVKTLIELQ